MTQDVLDIVSLEATYGNEAVDELLDMSQKEAKQLIEQIATSISQRDADMVSQKAHQLKGMSLTMTLNAMSDLSRDLEARAKAGSLEGADQILSELQSSYLQFEIFVRARQSKK